MKISLDLHDMSYPENQLYYLEKIREHYPNFKLSAFFIPYDVAHLSRLNDEQQQEAANLIRIAVAEGWLELIPHGLTHTFGEFHKATYEDMQLAMKAYDEFFKAWDVPYVKGFCAPNWLISQEAIKCLDDNGWWLAIDKNQPDCDKAKVNYTYSWDIVNRPPKDQEIVYGHGHMNFPSANNLPSCIQNILKIPPDAEWRFVSEVIKEQNGKD